MKNKQIITMLALAALLGGCNSKTGGNAPADTTATDSVEGGSSAIVPAEAPDSTLYGTCGDGSAMNTLQLITDDGDTMVVSIIDANDRGQCFGGYQNGDRMAVILTDENTAAQVVNLTAMTGQWVAADKTAINLKADGQAEITDTTATKQQRTWRLHNGRLVIGTDGAADNAQFEILAIGPDSLVLRGEDGLVGYSRK